MNKATVVILVASALVWGGVSFLQSIRSKSSQVPAWVAKQKARKKHPQEIEKCNWGQTTF